MTDIALPLLFLIGVIVLIRALSRGRATKSATSEAQLSSKGILDSSPNSPAISNNKYIQNHRAEESPTVHIADDEHDLNCDDVKEKEAEQEVEDLPDDEADSELKEFLAEREDDDALGPICTGTEVDSALPASGLFQLLCTKKADWKFYILETNQQTTGSITKASQNSLPLKPSSYGWELQDFNSSLYAETEAGSNVSIDLNLSKQSPIVFRLLANEYTGKQVQTIRDGNYLVLTPPLWRRANEISGQAAIEPEIVLGSTMTAHYFCIENSEPPIAFETQDGRPIVISPQAELFQLTGHAIPDETEELGTLFGKSLPKVLFPSSTPIEKGSQIELLASSNGGYEMIGKWPINSKAAIDLSKMVEKQKSGCYKIILRGHKQEAIQSTQFRYCRGLEGIHTHTQNEASSSHQEKINGILELVHLSSAKIHIAAEGQNRFQAQATTTGTLVCDKDPAPSSRVKFKYSDDTCTVPIPITAVCNKIWWCLTDIAAENVSQQPEWTDRPISIPATMLKSASRAVISIKLPTTRWANKISARLSKKSKKTYRPLVKEDVLQIKLRDFCDSRELEIPGTYPLIVECERSGKRTEWTAGAVEVICRCKFCEVESKSIDQALNHIVESHRTELFSPVSQQRQKQLELEAPDGIYHCDYCDLELIFKHYSDISSAVQRHLVYSCCAAPKENPKTPRLIQSKEDIVATLKSTQVCALCKEEFEGKALQEMAAHYATTHKSKTLKLMN